MILERGCANCHSSRTTWPWYSQVARFLVHRERCERRPQEALAV